MTRWQVLLWLDRYAKRLAYENGSGGDTDTETVYEDEVQVFNLTDEQRRQWESWQEK